MTHSKSLFRYLPKYLTLLSITTIFIGITLLLSSVGGCSNEVESSLGEDVSSDPNDWLVPVNEVFGGGPGKDGIPALNAPPMLDQAQATYLGENDLVIAVKVGSEVRGYSHQVLDWHEIINDKIGSSAFALTYCPLTGTAIAWDRVIDGTETTFGVSGLLYNTNLMPYDRLTNSTWSQMRLDCVNGELIRTEAQTYTVVETTWSTFKSLFPTGKVVSNVTGVARPYGQYPYGDYRTNNSRLLFPVDHTDIRLPRKERVVGVTVNGQHKAFPLESFGDTLTVINDTFNATPLVALGSSQLNLGVVFERRVSGGATLTFQPAQNQLPVVMTDNEGNGWDVFGEAISGPRTGEQLPTHPSYIAYWFAWGAFNQGSAIYGL